MTLIKKKADYYLSPAVETAMLHIKTLLKGLLGCNVLVDEAIAMAKDLDKMMILNMLLSVRLR